MFRTTQGFLKALDDEARQGLGVEEARALRNEIACHLDAAIQARMELGETPEEAERNAVAALGSPAEMIFGVSEVYDPQGKKTERPMLRAAWGLAAFVATYLFALPYAFVTPEVNFGFIRLYLVLTLCLLTLVGVFSFLHRKVALRRLLVPAAGAGVAVWLTLSVLWIDLGPEGEQGVAPRWQIESLLMQNRTLVAGNAFRREALGSILAARQAQGDDVRRLRQQMSAFDAQASDLERARQAIHTAAARSVPERLVATAGDAAGTAFVTWVGLALFNIAGATLGRRWSRRRRREEAYV